MITRHMFVCKIMYTKCNTAVRMQPPWLCAQAHNSAWSCTGIRPPALLSHSSAATRRCTQAARKQPCTHASPIARHSSLTDRIKKKAPAGSTQKVRLQPEQLHAQPYKKTWCAPRSQPGRLCACTPLSRLCTTLVPQQPVRCHTPCVTVSKQACLACTQRPLPAKVPCEPGGTRKTLIRWCERAPLTQTSNVPSSAP